MVEARATARHVRISPRRARQVMDLIRGKPVAEALRILSLSSRRSRQAISKTLRSAVANAVVREGSGRLTAEDLLIKRALVDEGATIKRWMPRAMGRASMIRRRTSHLTLIVTGEAKKEAKRGARKEAKKTETARGARPAGKTKTKGGK